MNSEDIVKMHQEMFEEDESKHGCGYYSVCIEHACPCSSTAAVSQGFNEEVWQRLSEEADRELRAMRDSLPSYYQWDEEDEDDDYPEEEDW